MEKKKDFAVIPLCRQLQRMGYTDSEIHRYLTKEGMSNDESIEVIREINKTVNN